MAITVSHLKNINTLNIDYVAGDFANSSSWYSDAEESFSDDVMTKVESPSVWAHGGQPDADVVMKINLSALTIGRIEMDAASTAMLTLATALGTAQGYLLTSVFEAEQKNLKVQDDGTLMLGEGAPVIGPDAIELGKDADRIEREIKGQLAFAAIADGSCKTLLDRIASHTPSYSTTADKNVLAQNGQTLADALYDRSLALTNQKFWQSAYPKAMPKEPSGWDKFWDGVGNFFSHLWDHAGELSLEGASMLGGGLLMALGGGIEVGGVALDATGIGAVVGVPANVLGAGVIATGATTVGLGALAMMNTAGDAASESSSDGGDEPASTTPKPPQNASDTLKYIEEHNGTPPPGFKGGKPYGNDPAQYAKPGETPGEKLPDTTSDGKAISYKEYDVNPKVKGQDRGEERLVIGDDGSVYYTDGHYQSFIQVR